MPQARRPALYAPMLRFGVALSPDAGGSGSGDGGGDNGAAADAAALDDAVARVLAKHKNDPNDVAALLIRERSRKDQEIADLKRQLREAKPAAGSKVVSAADAAEFDAFKALGKPAKEIADALTAGEQARGTLAAHERRTAMQTAAAAHGYAAPGAADVLADLAGRPDKGFAVEVRDETVDGRAAKVAYARPAGDDKAAWVKLPDYLTQHHAAYVPALTASAGGSTTGATGAGTSTTPRTAGAQYPPQAGGSTAPQADDPVSRRIAVRNEAATQRPNPFARGSAVRPAPAGAPAA